MYFDEEPVGGMSPSANWPPLVSALVMSVFAAAATNP